MRHLAGVLAAALVFALISPALAQPFADVPTNHWAYDAIAELAAKGLIEGYPDGTFKGDRAMTRYEMAMVVARLLARIESIQIPSPGAPQVTKADLAAIQRLINEFRAELAALGVRVTALEEELNAIKARLDNVRVRGSVRFRYNITRLATGPSINGNPNAKSNDASLSAYLPIAIEWAKLSFDGSVAPNVHFILGILSGASESKTTSQFVFNSSTFGVGTNQVLAAIDNAFFDWRNAFGIPLEIWAGRFGGGGNPAILGPSYPVQLGPFGLLLNTASEVWRDTTLNSGFNVADGVWVRGEVPALLGLNYQLGIIRVVGGTSGSTFAAGEDAYAGDISFQPIPGLRIGGDYVTNNWTIPQLIPVAAGAPNAFFHVYGPTTSFFSPATPLCPTAGAGAKGITCSAAGNGWGGYVQWSIVPGIHFDGEYAEWFDTINGARDTGYKGNFHIDIGTLTGIGHNVFVDAGWQHFGQNFYPPYGTEIADEAPTTMITFFGIGNIESWFAKISLEVVPKITIYGEAFDGHYISNAQPAYEWEAGTIFQFAPSASLTLKARQASVNNVEQFMLYRAELSYSF